MRLPLVLPERRDECVGEPRRPDERRDPVRPLVSIVRLGLRLLHGVPVRIPDEVARRGLRRGALEANCLPWTPKSAETRHKLIHDKLTNIPHQFCDSRRLRQLHHQAAKVGIHNRFSFFSFGYTILRKYI